MGLLAKVNDEGDSLDGTRTRPRIDADMRGIPKANTGEEIILLHGQRSICDHVRALSLQIEDVYLTEGVAATCWAICTSSLA